MLVVYYRTHPLGRRAYGHKLAAVYRRFPQAFLGVSRPMVLSSALRYIDNSSYPLFKRFLNIGGKVINY